MSLATGHMWNTFCKLTPTSQTDATCGWYFWGPWKRCWFLRHNDCHGGIQVVDFACAEDPTFVHPDQQNQGEREWLMKHNGGNAKEPREFWLRYVFFWQDWTLSDSVSCSCNFSTTLFVLRWCLNPYSQQPEEECAMKLLATFHHPPCGLSQHRWYSNPKVVS